MTKVLITGANGMLAKRLVPKLLEKNYEVHQLTRGTSANEVPTFKWDYAKGFIEEGALDGVDYIIHLAGAGVGDKKWSRERKKEIKDSRVKTAALLFDEVQKNNLPLKAYISASAIGYYGYDTGSIEKKEGSRFGDDFLATVVKEWEAEADKFAEAGIRTVKLRSGLVLDAKEGPLKKMSGPIKAGFGAALGRGDQYISWIHIDDLCELFIKAIEDEALNDVYNAASPGPVTNKDFMRGIAKVLKKPMFLPNVPGFVVKLMFGQMASMVLGGTKVSVEKISATGFEFKHPELTAALQDLIGK